MERCPSCRARLNQNPLCSRCGCNLEHVFSVEAQAENEFQQGLQAWACGHRNQAAAHFQIAMSLRATPLLAVLIACLGQATETDELTETCLPESFTQASIEPQT